MSKQHLKDDLVELVGATVEQQTGAQLPRHEDHPAASTRPPDIDDELCGGLHRTYQSAG
jgi:hypothetical protein